MNLLNDLNFNFFKSKNNNNANNILNYNFIKPYNLISNNNTTNSNILSNQNNKKPNPFYKKRQKKK